MITHRVSLLTAFLFITTLLACIQPALAQRQLNQEIEPSPVIKIETTDGRIVCAAGAFSQIPGTNDLFVGRGFGISDSIDVCHSPPKLPNGGDNVWRGFIALYKMDWQNNKMLFVNYLLKLPDRPAKGLTTSDGIYLAGAIDPYVVSYRGKLWVAFEGLVGAHGFNGSGSCMAPLSADLKQLDISKLTLVAAPTRQKSASTPALLNFHDRLYLYWTSCNNPRLDRLPQSKLVVHGMEIEEDATGRIWGKGSGGKPVATDDPRLTKVVYDVTRDDQTRDHTVNLWCLTPFGDKILVITSVGGTGGGPPCCCSPHESIPGCWRLSLSVAKSPLGDNVFNDRVFDGPLLPANQASYPRLARDPSGHHVLLGLFFQPKKLGFDSRDFQYAPGAVSLATGQSAKSNFGTLSLQGQGNLVLLDAKHKTLWSSPRQEKNSEGGFRAIFQTDGNLVIYHGDDPYWATNTAGHENATLILSQSPPFVSLVDKRKHALLWPWRISPWPEYSTPKPIIPNGLRYVGFDSILKQALQ